MPVSLSAWKSTLNSVTHAAFFPLGDSSIWDKGGYESQLLIKRCGQPHSVHQNQNQCPQRGPVHHPPCRSWGHVRWVTKPLWIFIPLIQSASVNVPSPCTFCSLFVFVHALQPLVYTPPQRCLTSVHCGHKVQCLTSFRVTLKTLHITVFL